MTKAKDLNFKMSHRFRYHFKLAAIRKGYKLKQLLEEAFDQWLRLNDIETWRDYQKDHEIQKRKQDKIKAKSDLEEDQNEDNN